MSGHVSPAVTSLYGTVLGAGLFLTFLTLGVVAWIIRSVAHVSHVSYSAHVAIFRKASGKLIMFDFSEKREDVEISQKMRSSKIRRKGLPT